jgi:hypothetical protein
MHKYLCISTKIMENQHKNRRILGVDSVIHARLVVDHGFLEIFRLKITSQECRNGHIEA